jgi:hypothetical protein
VPIASERASSLKIETAHRLDPLSGETIPSQKSRYSKQIFVLTII